MSSATRSRRWRGSRGAGPARRPADAGNLVATGTCAGLLQVLPGQTFAADFGGLGTVELEQTAR